MNRVIVVLKIEKENKKIDLDIPLDITANELILAINATYKLGMNTENITEVFLRIENPIALLKGNRTLDKFGMRNGTIINI